MTTLDEFINKNGFGTFSYYLLTIISFLWFVDGAQLTLSSLVSPKLRCELNLTTFETAFLSSAMFVGMGSGAVLIGWLSDKHGRKPILVLTLTIILYYSCLCIAADSFITILVTRIFIGIGFSGIMVSPCYVVENFAIQYRAKSMFILGLSLACGSSFASLMAYLLLNQFGWRTYLLIVIIPLPFILVFSLWLPESVRYLQHTGNYDGIMKILHYISKINKQPLPKSLNFRSNNNINRGSYKHIYDQYLFTTVISVGLFTLQMMLYLAGIFMSSQIYVIQKKACEYSYITWYEIDNPICIQEDNKEFLATFLSSLGNVIGCLIGFIISDFVGRKTMLYITTCITIAVYVVLNFCLPTYIITLTMFTYRVTSGINSNVTWLLIGETFPTHIRGTVFGLCLSTARLGAVFVPFFVEWFLYVSFSATTIIFVVLCLVSLFCIHSVDETLKKKHI